MQTYSNFPRQALAETLAYPRMTPDVARRDAWPPNGAPPGSDLDFMREQHLDLNGVEIGILIPLRGAGTQRNIDYGAALARAVNEWQVAYWLDKEPRLRGSILVNPEDPASAAKEIERCASDKRFVQVLLPPRAAEPLGRKRYWPIFEAAAKRRSADRHACRRRQRLSLHRRLGRGVLLHRGASLDGAGDAGRRHQHGDRRRVRGHSRP